MKILKQQQVNDIQNLCAIEGVTLTKTQIEACYDAIWDMIAIHQKDGDSVYTPLGVYGSYVRKPTTYTNPQHPEGERITSTARVIPKLTFGRDYYKSYRDIPVDTTTLERQ